MQVLYLTEMEFGWSFSAETQQKISSGSGLYSLPARINRIKSNAAARSFSEDNNSTS